MSWSKTFSGDTRRRQVVALQRALGCSRVEAAGWDALVRDLATEHDGDLTGWAAEDLEASLGWGGAPGALGAALRASGLLVEADGAVRPDGWDEREGSAHERDRKRGWRASRRRAGKDDVAKVGGGEKADTDGTVPRLSRDTDETGTGLSPQASPPVLPASLSLPTPLSYSPPLSIPPSIPPASASERTSESSLDPHTHAARLDRAFTAAWAELAASGAVRELRGVVVLDALTRKALVEAQLTEAEARELVLRVADSRYLSGHTAHGFRVVPRWLATNARRVLAGEWSDTRRKVRLDLVTPWVAGWARVDERAEAPSERTQARDLALTVLLEAWAASPATAAWTSPRVAEGAARELRARIAAGKMKATTLDEVARKEALAQELAREGEARTKPAAAAAPSAPPASAPPALTPKERLEGLRARKKLLPGAWKASDEERLAALEAELAETTHEPTAVRAVLQRVLGAPAAVVEAS